MDGAANHSEAAPESKLDLRALLDAKKITNV